MKNVIEWSNENPWALVVDGGYGNRSVVARSDAEQDLEVIKNVTDPNRNPEIKYLKGTGLKAE